MVESMTVGSASYCSGDACVAVDAQRRVRIRKPSIAQSAWWRTHETCRCAANATQASPLQENRATLRPSAFVSKLSVARLEMRRLSQARAAAHDPVSGPFDYLLGGDARV